MRKTRGKTSEIRKQINEATKRFLNGEMGYDEFVDFVVAAGKVVWAAIIDEAAKRVQNNLSRDELDAAMREAIAIGAKKVNNAETAFSYFRFYVRGYLKEVIKKLAFPFSVKEDADLEIERVSLNNNIDEDEEEPPYPAELVYVPTEFEEVEIRDLLQKTLNVTERTVAAMLLDGYSVSDIAVKVGLSLNEVEKIVEVIQDKLSRHL